MIKEKEKEPKDILKELKELKKESHQFDFEFKIGIINTETPLNIFIQKVCKEKFESLIFHKNLFVQEDSKECSILLLKEKLIKSCIIDSTDITKEKLTNFLFLEVKKILDIELEIEFSKNYYFIKLTYLKEASFENVGKLSIRFENQNDALIFKYFLEKERVNSWQKFFEEKIIQDPFYYQFHFFLKKVNRRGDKDSRVIVLTNEYILNIEYQFSISKKNDIHGNDISFKLNKPKWALSISSFEELQLIEKDKNKKTNYFMIKIKINQKENKDYINKYKLPFKNKSSTEFIFQNEKICRFFIFQIKRLYYIHSSKKTLKITES